MKNFSKKIIYLFLVTLSFTTNYIKSSSVIPELKLAKYIIKGGMQFVVKTLPCVIGDIKYYNWNLSIRNSSMTKIGFSFYNKSGKTVKIIVTGDGLPDEYKDRKKVETEINDKDIFNVQIDITKPVTLTIIDPVTNKKNKYTFEKNKTIYVTWQPDRKSGYLKDLFRCVPKPTGPLYPQTGPGGGCTKMTDSCFSKEDLKGKNTNIEQDDIRPLPA